MKGRMISNRKMTPRLFTNDVMETLSHVHPVTPLVLYLPLVIYGAWVGVRHQSLLNVMLLFFAGLITWTLVEYGIHRFIFHYQPHSLTGQRLHFIIHGIHHQYPSDPMRLVMPPVVSIPVAIAIYTGLIAAFGAAHAWPFGAGFALGYLVYDMTHFVLHHFTCKQVKFAWWLKRYHLRHHFQDETRGFGVSMPLWDYVFGTVPSKLS